MVLARALSCVAFLSAALCLISCLAKGPIYLGQGSSNSDCSLDFEVRAAQVMKRGGAATATFFPAGEAHDQSLRYPGLVCPELALELALRALIRSSESESLTEVVQALGQEDCSAQCYFNRQSSLFGLVADRSSALRSRFLPLPPSRASVAEHWIFYLSVPDLDEHGYWALVPRQGGRIETYAQN